MKTGGQIKVLIVDDSPLVRSMLTRVLQEAPEIDVVGGAKDPYEAREMIINFRPDVIILDIEMPRMDGLTFLKKLMEHYPVPVIMCSGVARDNSKNALQAIEIGAVDVVAKPNMGGSRALRQLGESLAEKIHAAAIAMPVRPKIPASAIPNVTSFRSAGIDPNRYFIAIGASTGGTEAIRSVLQNMPADAPPIAMVQHMPEGFTQSFAERLNQFSRLSVSEAVDNEPLTPGKALLARGGAQMALRSVSGQLRIAYGTDELVNRHCPSVDVLFDSVARLIGKQAVGVILTGMGADGARGLVNMREAGAYTIGQNQQSCVVYGMPKVAFEMGGVEVQCAPHDVPKMIVQGLRKRISKRMTTTST